MVISAIRARHPGGISATVQEDLEAQIRALSNMGLLARFVGMVTDSRSFLSYSRHDYFRRLLASSSAAPQQLVVIPHGVQVDEALRNVVACGGDPEHTAVLDNYCWGNCSNPSNGTRWTSCRASRAGRNTSP